MVGKLKPILAVSVIFLVPLSVKLGLHPSLLPAMKHTEMHFRQGVKSLMFRTHELEHPATGDINGNINPQIQSGRQSATLSSLHNMPHSEQSAYEHNNPPQLVNNQSADIHHCYDKLCTEYLKPDELRQFRDCTRRRLSRHENGTCRFTDRAFHDTVALASFPGSGSTWVRGLLEKATGICTGSVYCDTTLRNGGFNGEGVSGPAVLAVKTHESLSPFKAVIHLVRCPADAIVSEWNRKTGVKGRGLKHTASAPPEVFGSNEDWGEFVGEWSRRWSHASLRLAHYQETRPLIRVFYEDIKSNATREVLRMLDFLRVPHSKSLVEAKLGDGFGSFRRGAGRSFKHFTAQQRQVVVTMLSHVVRECSEKGYHDTEQYVQNYLSCL